MSPQRGEGTQAGRLKFAPLLRLYVGKPLTQIAGEPHRAVNRWVKLCEMVVALGQRY